MRVAKPVATDLTKLVAPDVAGIGDIEYPTEPVISSELRLQMRMRALELREWYPKKARLYAEILKVLR